MTNYKDIKNRPLLKEKYKSLSKNYNEYIKNKIDSEDIKIYKQSALLYYWLSDYLKYQKKCDAKRNSKYLKYKRGSIIKVNLGYRIGSEFGGLHYCIVLDKNDSPKKPTLTVIPLTSNTKRNHYPEDVYLGDNVTIAIKERISEVQQNINLVMSNLDKKKEEKIDDDLINLANQIILLDKEIDKLSNLKNCSVALCGQLLTIAKERIIEPKTNKDYLFDLKINNEYLNKIDKSIILLYTK